MNLKSSPLPIDLMCNQRCYQRIAPGSKPENFPVIQRAIAYVQAQQGRA